MELGVRIIVDLQFTPRIEAVRKFLDHGRLTQRDIVLFPRIASDVEQQIFPLPLIVN